MNLSVYPKPRTDFTFPPHHHSDIQEWAQNLTKNLPKIGLKKGRIQDWDLAYFYCILCFSFQGKNSSPLLTSNQLPNLLIFLPLMTYRILPEFLHLHYCPHFCASGHLLSLVLLKQQSNWPSCS